MLPPFPDKTTNMYGGYALLQLVAKDDATAVRRTWFTAGHAHAGVLLLAGYFFSVTWRTCLPCQDHA